MKAVLAPVFHKSSYNLQIEREIVSYFRDVIYGPLLEMLKDAGVTPDPKDQERQNAPMRSALERALQEGRVYYTDGVFTGTFSAAISREIRNAGGKWDVKRKVFTLPIERMPFSLRSAVGRSQTAAKELSKQILDTLGKMEQNIPQAPTGLNFAIGIDKVFTDLQKQFTQSAKAVENLEVPTQFTPELRKTLTERLTENSDLSIKNFAAERIPKLRQRVEANAFAGYRTDRLAKIIEAEFGIAKRKAEFIADQETGLLVAKYRQGRAEKLGSQSYVWLTSHDERVRHDHRMLDGKTFEWSNPPICDRATGRRCNPGEDFRCRCVPRIVVNYSEHARN